MCEIVVLDPDRTADEAIHQLAATLYEEQGDGFGILAVHVDDSFTYDAYRSTTPDWMKLHKFLQRNGDAWRLVLHGRAKTRGDVKRQNTHPLPIECEKCESVRWVVHNGSVQAYQQNKASLTSAGHEFTTGVDSEVIAHKVGELPDDIEGHDANTYNVRGNLHYLVFTDDGILARFGKKYSVTDDFIVSCGTRRRQSDAIDLEYSEVTNKYEWFRVTPATDDNEHDVLIERSKRPAGTSAYGGRTGTRSVSSRSSWKNRYENSDDATSSRAVTDPWTKKTYHNPKKQSVTQIHDDLVPRLAEVAAFKVAPGVIKVIDLEAQEDNINFVYKDKTPKLFRYYEGEGSISPDDFFDDEGDLVPAEDMVGLATLFPDEESGEVEEAVQEAVQTTVASETAEVVDGEGEDPLENSSSRLNNVLKSMTKAPSELKPPEVALLELTAVYGNAKQAEKELKGLTPRQIEELAANAIHVPKE